MVSNLPRDIYVPNDRLFPLKRRETHEHGCFSCAHGRTVDERRGCINLRPAAIFAQGGSDLDFQDLVATGRFICNEFELRRELK